MQRMTPALAQGARRAPPAPTPGLSERLRRFIPDAMLKRGVSKQRGLLSIIFFA